METCMRQDTNSLGGNFPSPLPRKGMETFYLPPRGGKQVLTFQVRFPERGWKLHNQPSDTAILWQLSKSASPKGDGNTLI
ncbi:MAG TPA: hypothetical protein DEG17_02840 [Cyanobacteria bacterium UBA11149]|nr:hypothetical protein [Cyanobacteria bacterium UBA11149]